MRTKQTQDERLLEALEDAETFADSTISELEETLKYLRKAKQTIHMRRMTLARKIKATK